ncbi:hypothetical protein HD_0055 [[Haemophilus] ducreyi 35000HP]|uniref:Uncharacterized protein n=1 Tax=Haemophilus ducreyi (strain 35000HP / ATCC 700724) TaxID=233412 RepID=Q7VPL0_HAEDU|nr:hypothetical protein HD_0055 [[Haemophilus] ducreyi 35000HP]
MQVFFFNLKNVFFRLLSEQGDCFLYVFMGFI